MAALANGHSRRGLRPPAGGGAEPGTRSEEAGLFARRTRWLRAPWLRSPRRQRRRQSRAARPLGSRCAEHVIRRGAERTGREGGDPCGGFGAVGVGHDLCCGAHGDELLL